MLAANQTDFAAPVEESLFYVTALSNLVRGYDKYGRVYDKAKIPESTFPGQFFLLTRNQLPIGITKASALLLKTGVPGDHLIVLETTIAQGELRPNLRTGLGRFIERSYIRIAAMHFITESNSLEGARVEDAYAQSLRLHISGAERYNELTPRSVSVLPVAKACQANCPFCFSKASASEYTETKPVDWARIRDTLRLGRLRGASRAVITGGGEPTLLKAGDLQRLIHECAAVFPKVVLITNGFQYGRLPESERVAALRDLDDAGLSIMSISRHHFDPACNAALMNLVSQSEQIAATIARIQTSLRQLKLRWVCVLQRGGIENRDLLERYLDWSIECGIDEVCFKELYVSSSVESEYHDHAANDWSARNQIPLSLVVNVAQEAGWQVVDKLPWGAPIYEGIRRGHRIRVAAYTEPNPFWELTHGLCRSWNLMADGRCLASLEDRKSEVLTRGLYQLPAIS